MRGECQGCEFYNKEFGCEKHPTELVNSTCLLRHIAITLNYFMQEMCDDSDDGNWWKQKE